MNISSTSILLFFSTLFITLACHNSASPKIDHDAELNKSLALLGNHRTEFKKVLDHYSRPEDSLKKQAARYLLTGLPFQFFNELDEEAGLDSVFRLAKAQQKLSDRRETVIHYLDSCKINTKFQLRRDIDVIDAEFLIENIELAFEAWQLPWCRHLSFEDFCLYILPYKNEMDKPTRWRRELRDRFRWVHDSLSKDGGVLEVCKLINKQLRTDCGLMTNMGKIPVILHYDLMKIVGFGLCRDITNYTTYCMRANGVPVTWDFTAWSSRSLGHDWNTILLPTTRFRKERFIPFLGGDIDPFFYKIENEIVEYNRRSKVFRKSYLPQKDLEDMKDGQLIFQPLIEDVSADFLSVSDLDLKLDTLPESQIGFVTTYDDNSRRFRNADFGLIENGVLRLKNLGRNNCYLPVFYDGSNQFPLHFPVILRPDGAIHTLMPDVSNFETVKLFSKYPYYNSNKIKIGETYELMYWDKYWKSIGKQIAKNRFLVFDRVPMNSLLILRNLDRGVQERPFTYEGKKQVWW